MRSTEMVSGDGRRTPVGEMVMRASLYLGVFVSRSTHRVYSKSPVVKLSVHPTAPGMLSQGNPCIHDAADSDAAARYATLAEARVCRAIWNIKAPRAITTTLRIVMATTTSMSDKPRLFETVLRSIGDTHLARTGDPHVPLDCVYPDHIVPRTSNHAVREDLQSGGCGIQLVELQLRVIA